LKKTLGRRHDDAKKFPFLPSSLFGFRAEMTTRQATVLWFDEVYPPNVDAVVEESHMNAAANHPLLFTAPDDLEQTTHAARRRRIDPKSRQGLALLGHAIEYLTSDSAPAPNSPETQKAQLQAVSLLMALNHEIYFSCPEAPSFGQRCATLLNSIAL
jgi:hypothetical protein